ncbi:DNA invertase Pin-like site-specific DNA recombinase [Parabacteroides sp. PFB2-12]|uniref:recombinase family protein n=1 Tax=unclassified Parabacteroides TaxID=2649774 RepID=UPI00247630ED|nr:MULTISPECIES: recombinase family protein [unclassified Parabacteroides]MDH6343169.1 DNA invertase Pin-like site-specific DNA recombinase [Parabacteroides sp. PM6-13]MDH6390813.1 DNA invertase Pin-like site-specific DNA recombinase [Parabacteroides sp. PFB2-12]
METAVILARVSTLSQDYDRQVAELSDFAAERNITVLKVFANKVSGAKKNEERPEITDMVQFVKKNHVDKVLVLEISRLGRDTLEALKVIELLNNEQICLYVKNYNIETLDSKGNINPMAQFLITILLEVGRMERTTIRQRMQSGYENHLKNGGSVGRKAGYRKSDDIMKEQYKEEIRLLKKNISYRNIHKITGTSPNTLRKLKKIELY